MKTCLLVISALLSLAAGPNPDRAIVLYGPMMVPDGLVVGSRMLIEAAAHPGEPIDLVISSPGGAVDALDHLVTIIGSVKRQYHSPIRCWVGFDALSAAFFLLTACDERHALKTSRLMFHRIRVFVMAAVITAPSAEKLRDELEQADEKWLKILQEAFIRVPRHTIYNFREAEYMFTGYTLSMLAPGFVTTHEDIPGLLEILAPHILAAQTKRE